MAHFELHPQGASPRWSPLSYALRRQRRRSGRAGPHRALSGASLERQQVARARVRGRVTQLAHGARLDLTDPLAREVHLGAHVFEGANLAGTVKAKAHAQDLLLAL